MRGQQELVEHGGGAYTGSDAGLHIVLLDPVREPLQVTVTVQLVTSKGPEGTHRGNEYKGLHRENSYMYTDYIHHKTSQNFFMSYNLFFPWGAKICIFILNTIFSELVKRKI